MLIQITILAIFFLDELRSVREWIGIGIIDISTVLIQYLRSPDGANANLEFDQKNEITQT